MQQSFTEYIYKSSLDLVRREAESNLRLFLKDYIKHCELETYEYHDHQSDEVYELPSSYPTSSTSSNVSFMLSYKRREIFQPDKISAKFDWAIEELKIDVDILNQKYIHVSVNQLELSKEKDPKKQQQLYDNAKSETRRLRKLQNREKAALTLRAGVIGGKFGGVKRATMWQINEQVEKNKDTARFLKSHMAIGRGGEQIDLSNVFERKKAEFSIVAKGIQTVAETSGMAWAKIVVTAPPQYHINPILGQYKWDGTMPDELCKKWARQWARLRSALLKQCIKLVGLWTRETHADGTPHLNFLIYMEAGGEQIVKDAFHEYMSLGNTSIKAIKYVKMDQYQFGVACGFAKYAAKSFAKYSAKNIDTDNQNNIDAVAEQCLASAFGWRRWGFFGIPPLSQWRALRSQKNCPNSTPLLDSMWRAARGNRFCDFINLNGGLAATAKTRTIQTHSEKSTTGKSRILTGVIDKKTGYLLITKQVGYFELVKIQQNQVVTVKITYPRDAGKRRCNARLYYL